MNAQKILNFIPCNFCLTTYPLNIQQLNDIKTLLANYFAEQATQEMDKLWDENNWDDNTMAE